MNAKRKQMKINVKKLKKSQKLQPRMEKRIVTRMMKLKVIRIKVVMKIKIQATLLKQKVKMKKMRMAEI